MTQPPPMEEVEAEIERRKRVPKLEFLKRPARYKVAFGGRGGAKSWTFARELLLQGAARPLRILCAREMQNSIADSVHHLLETQIAVLGLSEHYEVQKATILGRNGTEFIFAGLKVNINNIKSYEACDIVWVEEAANVSDASWSKLIPTIRKAGSEIWVTFNPELDTDATYRRFVQTPPPNAVVVKVNGEDNPWFPDTLKRESDHLLAVDPNAWAHIYGGQCKSAVEGAIYQKEIREAEAAGRITRVPYDPTVPVHTFWDLGFGDMVSIWMAQVIGFEYRFIDYEEGSQNAINYYLQRLQTRPYIWGTDWLPWDGAAKQLGTGRSIQELMQAAGRSVRVVPRLAVTDGINAVRTIFPQCWFDSEKCLDGIQALRRYRWATNADGDPQRQPLHDSASHPSDALRTAGVGLKQPKKAAPQVYRPTIRVGAWG